MEIAFLPHYFKYVAYALVIPFILDASLGFYSGFMGLPNMCLNIPFDTVLFYLGMMTYMFTKEKIEDEYVQIKRANAFTTSFIITLFIFFFLSYIMKIEHIEIYWVFFTQLVLYILTFKILKD